MADYRSWQAAASAEPKTSAPGDRTVTRLLAIVLTLLALLSWGEVYIYMQLKKVQDVGDDIAARSINTQETLRKNMEQQMDDLEQAYQRSTGRMHEDIAKATGSVASTHEEIKKTAAMAEKIRAEQQRVSNDLSNKLASKADQQQVGALSKDVTATRRDLTETKKNLLDTIDKLGMTRTEFGTLIARNHGEIEQLRKLGDREYFEFNLVRSGPPQQIGGIGLQLRKTNPKKLRYTILVIADDYQVEKKDRTINEPVFFFVHQHKQPVELIVNQMDGKRALGYISIPREPAAGSTGATQ